MSIALKDVTFSYEGAPPLFEGFSLQVPDGASVALMGPSGSGKSTLLAILGLLLPTTSGEVVLDGDVVEVGRDRHRRHRQPFAWVFQTVSVLPGRSVLDNVAVGLLARGAARDEIEDRCREALDLVGLGGFADRRINSLSGGEVQRVCVARGLVAEPRVLLADEPTGQLDADNSMHVVDAMLRLRRGSTSIVLATHDHAVAERCDVVIALSSRVAS